MTDRVVIVGLLGCLALTISSGCGRGLSTAADRPDGVSIVAGEGVSPGAVDVIERALAQEVSRGSSEPFFHVERVPPDKFDRARKKGCLVILVNLSVPGRIARAARDALTSQEAAEAGAGTGLFFVKRDLWTADQAVLFLPGANAQNVLTLAETRSEKIRDALLATAKERAARRLFRNGEDKETMSRVASTLGWTVRIPARGWRHVEDPAATAQEGRLRLEADHPKRAVTILWGAVDSTRLQPETGTAWLEEVGAERHLWGALDRGSLDAHSGKFSGHPALFLKGRRSAAAGSSSEPFETTLYQDAESSRLYVIDRAIEGSGGDPYPKVLFWEMEAITATFHGVAGTRATSG